MISPNYEWHQGGVYVDETSAPFYFKKVKSFETAFATRKEITKLQFLLLYILATKYASCKIPIAKRTTNKLLILKFIMQQILSVAMRL